MLTRASKEKLLEAGEIKIAGREVLIEENPYAEGAPEYVTLRVHWNHDFISPLMVPSLLMAHIGSAGVIVRDDFELSVEEDFPNARTGVRRLVIKTKDKARILKIAPHLLEGVVDGVRFRFLVTIVGRPALCLKCKGEGHKSFECPEKQYCQHCSVWGHPSGDCRKKDTYAARLSSRAGAGLKDGRKVGEGENDLDTLEHEGQVVTEDESGVEVSREQPVPSRETRSACSDTPPPGHASSGGEATESMPPPIPQWR
jgi:hypothetical protein